MDLEAEETDGYSSESSLETEDGFTYEDRLCSLCDTEGKRYLIPCGSGTRKLFKINSEQWWDRSLQFQYRIDRRARRELAKIQSRFSGHSRKTHGM